MGLRYSHLSDLERSLIEHGRQSDLGFAAIGRLIRRSASTVMRETQRGQCEGFGRYLAIFGQRHYAAGRRRAGLLRRKLRTDLDSSTWQFVRLGLSMHWSRSKSPVAPAPWIRFAAC